MSLLTIFFIDFQLVEELGLPLFLSLQRLEFISKRRRWISVAWGVMDPGFQPLADLFVFDFPQFVILGPSTSCISARTPGEQGHCPVVPLPWHDLVALPPTRCLRSRRLLRDLFRNSSMICCSRSSSSGLMAVLHLSSLICFASSIALRSDSTLRFRLSVSIICWANLGSAPR